MATQPQQPQQPSATATAWSPQQMLAGVLIGVIALVAYKNHQEGGNPPPPKPEPHPAPQPNPPPPGPQSDLAKAMAAAYATDQPTDVAAKIRARNILASLYQILSAKVQASAAGTTVGAFLDLKNRAAENALGKTDLMNTRYVVAKAVFAICGDDPSASMDKFKSQVADLYQQASDILDTLK